jgi:hypothetical protein
MVEQSITKDFIAKAYHLQTQSTVPKKKKAPTAKKIRQVLDRLRDVPTIEYNDDDPGEYAFVSPREMYVSFSVFVADK